MLGPLVRGLTYGYLPEQSEPMKLMAVALNYSLIVSCLIRYRRAIAWKWVLMLITVNCVAFYCNEALVGMSTVWCFAYGHRRDKQAVDHTIFWCANVGVVIPYTLFMSLQYDYMWPWPPIYFFVCNMAHLLSALFGLGINLHEKCRARQQRQLTAAKQHCSSVSRR